MEPCTDGSTDIEALLRQLNSRSASHRARAAEALRAGGHDLVLALSTRLHQTVRQRKARMNVAVWILAVVDLVSYCAAMFNLWHTNRIPVLMLPCSIVLCLSATVMVGLAVQRSWPTRLQRSLVEVLCQLDDPGAIGAVAHTLLYQETLNMFGVSWPARETLIRLLPRLRASDAHLLNDEQRACLHKLLTTPGTPLRLAIVRSLEQIGDVRAIPYVEKLIASRTTPAEVRQAAEACLPYLQERAEHERVGASLLRPAEGVGDASSSLVRPATAAEASTERLVRPARVSEE